MFTSAVMLLPKSRSFHCRSRNLEGLLTLHSVVASTDMQSDLLSSINLYRSTQGLPALKEDPGYNCVAQRYAEAYSFPPCDAFTGPFPAELSNSADEATWKTTCNAATAANASCRDNLKVCGLCTGGLSSLVLMATVPTYLKSSSLCGVASKDLESAVVGLGSSKEWLVLVVQPPGCNSSANSLPSPNATNSPPNAAVPLATSLLTRSIAGAAAAVWLLL